MNRSITIIRHTKKQLTLSYARTLSDGTTASFIPSGCTPAAMLFNPATKSKKLFTLGDGIAYVTGSTYLYTLTMLPSATGELNEGGWMLCVGYGNTGKTDISTVVNSIPVRVITDPLAESLYNG